MKIVQQAQRESVSFRRRVPDLSETKQKILFCGRGGVRIILNFYSNVNFATFQYPQKRTLKIHLSMCTLRICLLWENLRGSAHTPHPLWPMLMLLACCVLSIGFFLKNIISIFLLMPPLFIYKSYLKFEKKNLKSTYSDLFPSRINCSTRFVFRGLRGVPDRVCWFW